MNKNRNILFVIFTHNRPAVMKESLRTIFENTSIKPSNVLILDDGSQQETKDYLYDFCKKGGYNFYSGAKPYGYCRNFRLALKHIEEINPDYVFFMESDYYFRKNYLEECFAVNDLDRSVGVTGFSHPDFVISDKTNRWYGEVVTEQFGEDIKNRDKIYKVFTAKTEAGDIDIQYGTHSCGTFFWNRKRFLELLIAAGDGLLGDFETILDRATEYGEKGRVINDGMITGGISLFWSKAIETLYGATEDSPHSAFIDIFNPSIALHVAGGGVNGSDAAEGQTSVRPINWPTDYNNFQR